ncbi:MAG: hypothetical protein H0X39_05855 [Actinobacteria bacterium]|nr:hypothetical protein [Actinomycetota bacterium]
MHVVTDLDAKALLIAQLEHREAEIARRLEKLRERHAQYPNSVSSRQVAELDVESRQITRDIDGLRRALDPAQ